MVQPKDSDIYPLQTVVRLIKTGEFAIIKKQVFLKDGKNFMHYLGYIEGREFKENSYYVLYHNEIEVEVLP